MFDNIGRGIYSCDLMCVKNAADRSKVLCIAYIEASQNLADVCEHIQSTKKEYEKQLTILEVTVNNIVHILVNDIKSNIIKTRNITLLTKYISAISIAYTDHMESDLIKRTLDYTYSIDIELAKKVVTAHDNLILILEDGKYYQP
jgi:hypothetical protein